MHSRVVFFLKFIYDVYSLPSQTFSFKLHPSTTINMKKNFQQRKKTSSCSALSVLSLLPSLCLLKDHILEVDLSRSVCTNCMRTWHSHQIEVHPLSPCFQLQSPGNTQLMTLGCVQTRRREGWWLLPWPLQDTLLQPAFGFSSALSCPILAVP